jgi:hypothetical protein
VGKSSLRDSGKIAALRQWENCRFTPVGKCHFWSGKKFKDNLYRPKSFEL